MSLAAALLKTQEPLSAMQELIDLSALVQPILILSLLMLAASNDWLHRLQYRHAIGVIVAAELVIATAVYSFGAPLLNNSSALARCLLFTLIVGCRCF